MKTASQVADLTTDTCRKAFIGAIAIRRDGTLVSARNGSTTKFNCNKTPSTHAEYRVLRKAGYGSTIYVAQVLRNGKIDMAKPCSRCMAMLRSKGVEMVYYTISPNDWEGYQP